MELTDSRRLTGPSLVLDRPGAAAEISVTDRRDEALQLWRSHVRTLLNAVGWPDETMTTRAYAGGATVAITAPIDALYAATEVVEAAWDRTVADLSDLPAPDHNATVERLRGEIADEINPALLTLANAARSHAVTCLSDDEHVTLGLGRSSRSWPCDALPAPDKVDWGQVGDIPVALVTGTNGKSTTVRIAAAIGAAAGRTVGFSTSDWVRVGDTEIATGDYSGPEGARQALRDQRVDMAVLETARGGLLRRGLPVSQAAACLITNVASDHLGEYGIHDVDALADTKFTVSKAVRTSGTLVLNADDPRLKSRGEVFPGQVAWYGLSLTPDDVPDTADAALVANDQLCLLSQGRITPLLPVADFTPALGGAAAHNVSNALAASLLMHSLGVAPDAIMRGLLDFENTPDSNPGRGNLIQVGGVTAMLDFAHNPHSLKALTQTLNSVPADRRLYLLGQGGDRSDEDIRRMTQVIREAEPDTIIIKEIPSKLRGREAGEVPALIRTFLDGMDYPRDDILTADSELEAAIMALEWARPGDLLVLLVYAERDETLALIQRLQTENWQAGQPVPH
ncbi:Mur ligase family protein [Algimonas porphyrae]|uniref:Mur ligase n=1 Tax=Algimonas porphyrae TaxID=1128113 RepID=A0ABQ5V3R2_9PROT|nr:Mur ligase family protein [Algimonas porphyrae]GLQ21359.1 Mur ligase [Algimonas porphyrae]